LVVPLSEKSLFLQAGIPVPNLMLFSFQISLYGAAKFAPLKGERLHDFGF
jgi:hypothetical protein